MDDDIDEKEKKRHFYNAPCFRTSFLTGIGCGIGGGLGTFLFTSNIRKASNVGIGAYLVLTVGTWVVCRYRRSVDVHEQRQMNYFIKDQARSRINNVEKTVPQVENT